MKDKKKKFYFVERRKDPWDRRIPKMPNVAGNILQFIYKSRKRFWSLFTITFIIWIWIVATITIWLHGKFPYIMTNLFHLD